MDPREMLMVALHDSKAEMYLTPWFAPNAAHAQRTFEDLVNDPKGKIKDHAEDYTLFAIGRFNVETGEVVAACEAIIRGMSVRRDDGQLSLLQDGAA